MVLFRKISSATIAFGITIAVFLFFNTNQDSHFMEGENTRHMAAKDNPTKTLNMNQQIKEERAHDTLDTGENSQGEDETAEDTDDKEDDTGEIDSILEPEQNNNDADQNEPPLETGEEMDTKSINNVPNESEPSSMSDKSSASSSMVSHIRSNNIDCAALFNSDENEIQKAEGYQRSPVEPIGNAGVLNIAKDCKSFTASRGYIMSPVNKEEAEFPLAFSVVLYKQADMVERLLRAIYRPQNVYCIHVDFKATQDVKDAMESVANCFDNVFMASREVSVQWGHYSVLEAEMVCLEDLWKYPHWKYFINLTGQEFPLQTNLDIVRILKTFKGGNNIGTAKFISSRLQYKHYGHKRLPEKKSPPPGNYTMAKGSVHVALTRDFVDYVLHNEDAIRFRDWLVDTGCPVESFFQALYLSPQMGVPGASTTQPDGHHRIPGYHHIVRYKLWADHKYEKCHGKFVRMICIPGILDLPTLARRKEMFVNKFNQEYQPLAYDCLEELHRNRTIEDITGQRTFDMEFYGGLKLWMNHTNVQTI